MDKYFTLISKPEQSGKTFVMIHEIINNFKNIKESKRIINIILCDNSLLLNKQTKERLDVDLGEITTPDLIKFYKEINITFDEKINSIILFLKTCLGIEKNFYKAHPAITALDKKNRIQCY